VKTVQVVLLVTTRALDRPLDYAVPEVLHGRVGPGALVACPLGRRTELGVVIGTEAPTWDGKLAVLAGIVEVHAVPDSLMELAGWIARYYAAPLAACLRLVLPPKADGTLRRRADGGWWLAEPPRPPAQLVVDQPREGGTARQQQITAVVRAAGGSLTASALCTQAATTMATLRRMAEAGLLTLERRELAQLSAGSGERAPGPTLNVQQQDAVNEIQAALARGQEALLIHGVTGSGKTEVYIHAIETARARGRGAIVLAPEIALTPQLLERLRARLGAGVAVWHSGLSDGERAVEDRRIRSGEADVVLGARSAVFAPLANVGLIIVDEEHEASYKQDALPRYDARQVAYRRGRLEDALVVYGSATPRPESWWALPHVTLTERADGAPLPDVQIVDMRMQAPGPISRPLARALQEAAAVGDKAILLLNRRGLARMCMCRACGWIARCPSCDVPLVVHDRPEHLVCHHCGYDAPVPTLCPSCRAAEIVRQGSGTQGLEEALRAIVPDVPLVRLDGDVIGRRGELEARLKRFAKPGAAILLGTQMVAKGHDLPAVTVAGVLDADGALQRPDFRAEERAFSLIVQLAGRAGRRGEPSTVFVQAWEPDGRAVRLGARHAVQEFLAGEIHRRQDLMFPPFGHLVRVVIDGASAAAVATAASAVADGLRESEPDMTVRGPATLHRLRGRSRRAVLVRAERATDVTLAVTTQVQSWQSANAKSDVRIVVDVDPQDT
jgi:primosomal protein N' (replication factor Y) (superfamily II helicase)